MPPKIRKVLVETKDRWLGIVQRGKANGGDTKDGAFIDRDGIEHPPYYVCPKCAASLPNDQLNWPTVYCRVCKESFPKDNFPPTKKAEEVASTNDKQGKVGDADKPWSVMPDQRDEAEWEIMQQYYHG